MSSKQERPYDRAAMLAAFREQRAPRADTIDALWERLQDEGVAADEAPVSRPRVSRTSLSFAAAAALAAAFVLGWWLRGAPLFNATVAEPANMANREADAQRAGGQSSERRRGGSSTSAQPPSPEAEAPSSPAAASRNNSGVSANPTAASAGQERSPALPATGASPRPLPPSDRAPRSPKPATPRDLEPPNEIDPAPPATLAQTLAEETALIRRARRALASDDAAKALQILGDYRARFVGGTLFEESEALRAMARCQQVQPEARSELREAFAAAYRSSMQQAGVDRACAP